MSAEPIGYIPSPYGKPVAVYRNDAMPDGYAHDFDGCMDIAGIHGTGDRARCKAQLKAECGRDGISFDIFLAHGGRTVPRVQLPKATEAVYPTLPADAETDIPIELWVTLAMEQPHWCSRASVLLDIICENLRQAEGWEVPPEISAIGMSLLLTATMEHLAEHEIACIEAAAFYALTNHLEWSTAGLRWLEPFRHTWFADWIAERPNYRRFAALRLGTEPVLPDWIAGGPAC